MFYKIKSLYKLGVEIHLHTFEYGKGEAKELDKYCKKVYYYKRKTAFKSIFSRTPYIVNSRRNKELIKNLCSIKAPILFEGLHTTSPLQTHEFKNRKIFIRTHNIEHYYYKKLSRSEKNIPKKIFFSIEATKLKLYNKILTKCNSILTISKFEQEYFNEKFNSKAIYIPVFHGNISVKFLSKKGNFALYHGNLNVSDNIKAINYLVDIFKTLDYPLVITGNIENSIFRSKINKYGNIKFIHLNNQEQLNDLLDRAHINVLPTFQKTGIKLKLINSLFNSRFCIVNPDMVDGTGLESLCYIAKTKMDFKKQIVKLINEDFLENERVKRESILKDFDNSTSAKKILELMNQ